MRSFFTLLFLVYLGTVGTLITKGFFQRQKNELAVESNQKYEEQPSLPLAKATTNTKILNPSANKKHLPTRVPSQVADINEEMSVDPNLRKNNKSTTEAAVVEKTETSINGINLTKTDLKSLKAIEEHIVKYSNKSTDWWEVFLAGLVQNFPVTILSFLLGFVLIKPSIEDTAYNSKLIFGVYNVTIIKNKLQNTYTKKTTVNLGIYSSTRTTEVNLNPTS